MDQENIFKLLLIILLMGNNQANQCRDDCRNDSFWSSANEIMLTALLLGLITDRSEQNSTSTESDTNTTFG